jgi:fatty-acyl-CoA synthase
MTEFATLADIRAIEAEKPWAERGQARSMYEYLTRAKEAYGNRPAISYQLLSGPADKNVTLSWAGLHAEVTRAANLFRSLGVGEKDVVAFVLPNAMETAVTLLAGAVAGIVNPINPLLEPEKISAILRETGAKVVVTLKAFPKTDLPQKVAEAVKFAPNVKTVLEVDLVGYLSGLKKVIVPLIRPKNPISHNAAIKDFRAEVAKSPPTG